jgi:hypothetical protein
MNNIFKNLGKYSRSTQTKSLQFLNVNILRVRQHSAEDFLHYIIEWNPYQVQVQVQVPATSTVQQMHCFRYLHYRSHPTAEKAHSNM